MSDPKKIEDVMNRLYPKCIKCGKRPRFEELDIVLHYVFKKSKIVKYKNEIDFCTCTKEENIIEGEQ